MKDFLEFDEYIRQMKTVEEQIKAFKTKGVLSRIGSTKGGYWEINE